MTDWQNEPFAIDVKAGESKAFCMCGLSKNGDVVESSWTVFLGSFFENPLG